MKIDNLIKQSWECYCNKVANGLLDPHNEKMMQLQLAQIFQTLAPIYEFSENESIKIILEKPVKLTNGINRIIDIVIAHEINAGVMLYPIELKCFRLYSIKSGKKRGAQNLGMYDYWEDIENIESYTQLTGYSKAYQLTVTDDFYYVETEHKGGQVAVYSTSKTRINVTGRLEQAIKNRDGKINLTGTYNMNCWEKIGNFYSICQST